MIQELALLDKSPISFVQAVRFGASHRFVAPEAPRQHRQLRVLSDFYDIQGVVHARLFKEANLPNLLC